MKNPENVLVVLDNEEREAAEEFLRQRLRLLGDDRISELKELARAARAHLQSIQTNRGRLDTSGRAGAILARMYDSALAGNAKFITDCNLAIATAKKKRDSGAADDVQDGAPPADDGPDLRIVVREEEEKEAWQIVQSTLAVLKLNELRQLRDDTEELLRWWQSDQGQQVSLSINQYGNLQSANGRIAIRKARDEMLVNIITPIREFFQTTNLIYQRMNQEHRQAVKQKDLQEQAGL